MKFITLQQAIDFKKMGVAQESTFYYAPDVAGVPVPTIYHTASKAPDNKRIYSAFTLMELARTAANIIDNDGYNPSKAMQAKYKNPDMHTFYHAEFVADPIHLKDLFDDEAFENRRFDRIESQEDYLEEEN
jgi:hypothetical protein